MDKNILRKKYLNKRKSMDTSLVNNKSEKIINNLYELKEYKLSKCIMTYISFRNEIKTENLIKESIKNNKKIVVPLTDTTKHEMTPSLLYDYDNELSKGAYGIYEPKSEYIRIVDPNIIDLVIIPGSVFDINGNRIGYGGGYYDKFLKTVKKSTYKIALAYDFQVVSNINPDKYDMPVDLIITEERIINCKIK